MANNPLVEVPLASLQVNKKNPRYKDDQESEREAIGAMVAQQGEKLFKLAEDIVKFGLNPIEQTIVEPNGDGTYCVLEGNRRVATLKLLSNPELCRSLDLGDKLQKRLAELSKTAGDALPSSLFCHPMSEAQAKHWIELRHTGENQGAGVSPWNTRQRHRFRGMSIGLDVMDLLEELDRWPTDLVVSKDDFPLTNVERVLHTKEARDEFDVEIKNKKLLATSDFAIQSLVELVRAIGGKDAITVSAIKHKDERIEFAKKIAARVDPSLTRDRTEVPSAPPASEQAAEAAEKEDSPVDMPPPNAPISPPNDGVPPTPPANAPATPPPAASSGSKGSKVLPHSQDRDSVVPKNFKLTIPTPKLNDIFHELRTLSLKDHTNACAVLLRVFIELSVDDYLGRNGISTSTAVVTSPPPPCKKCGEVPVKNVATQMPKLKKLSAKIKETAEHLKTAGKLDDQTIKPALLIAGTKEQLLTVDSLHAYVHHTHFTPIASELKALWDNLTPFIRAVWS